MLQARGRSGQLGGLPEPAMHGSPGRLLSLLAGVTTHSISHTKPSTSILAFGTWRANSDSPSHSYIYYLCYLLLRCCSHASPLPPPNSSNGSTQYSRGVLLLLQLLPHVHRRAYC
jgi:hypothetical protein